jgi:hypothetical protein
MQDDFMTHVAACVEEKVGEYLATEPVLSVVSLTFIEQLCRTLLRAVANAVLSAWKQRVAQIGMQLALSCPGCSRRRSCKWRLQSQMRIRLLGLDLQLPKLYLECHHCPLAGISITTLLTGLHSGDASVELQLSAAYSAAHNSYAKAAQDLQVHHGQTIDRTQIRAMALQVERQALWFAERDRRVAVDTMSSTAAHQPHTALLVMQGDGGKVRAGPLVQCEPGDPGFGQMTPKTNTPKRKRPSTWREVITLDARTPDEDTPSALDVVVPVVADPGQRTERMRALAARKGMGPSTQVIGLGDMGSGLAAAFKQAFEEQPDSFWSADWKHTSDYADNASSVLTNIDVDDWRTQMKSAIWNRDRISCNMLLRQAKDARVEQLPSRCANKCPVHALNTYLDNNWQNMHAARLKTMGLDFVSARAEAQVRDRTKGRFGGPGTWLEENLESKATTIAIINDGRWERFRQEQIRATQSQFELALVRRLQHAVNQGRLSPESIWDLIEPVLEQHRNSIRTSTETTPREAARPPPTQEAA